MTDQVTSDQQTNSGQQVDWEARYKGSVRKIEELTLSHRSVSEQLAAKSSELEQLKVQLSSKDVEKEVALNQSGKLLGEKEATLNQLKIEVASLRGLKTKMDAIKKSGRPELLDIIDTIPVVDDPAAMEAVIKQLSDFATNIEKKRESQLTSGVTPATSVATNNATMPTDEGGWTKYMEQFPLGSPERAKAMDQFWNWGNTLK